MLTERQVDHLHNPIDVFENIAIPVPDDLDAVQCEKFCAAVIEIFAFLGMLPTIDLNRPFRFGTIKIEHITAVWHLSAKLPSIDLAIAQSRPELCFCIGWLMLHRSGQLIAPRPHGCTSPLSLILSPKGRGNENADVDERLCCVVCGHFFVPARCTVRSRP